MPMEETKSIYDLKRSNSGNVFSQMLGAKRRVLHYRFSSGLYTAKKPSVIDYTQTIANITEIYKVVDISSRHVMPGALCTIGTEASFGGVGAVSPLPRKKKKKKKRKKKRKKRKKEEKREKRKKGTMNNVKLINIKCLFFQFFNSQVALKNKKKFGPPRKS